MLDVRQVCKGCTSHMKQSPGIIYQLRVRPCSPSTWNAAPATNACALLRARAWLLDFRLLLGQHVLQADSWPAAEPAAVLCQHMHVASSGGSRERILQ
eukprot:CAMPEP_0168414980 /NCGR_PEP_ID=MMETSP0228-20121227/30002_1 /TAXON_ID=133427 /ORGANISM="Protoceratium reticulatum, Strain CCCM 535 (=CCMP 1889)" /LENGTH=97 /DNA_ID=CAMNT_0008428787 /DNA_START=63 /DNA_END=353 /DNA_ORIENTATION=-